MSAGPAPDRSGPCPQPDTIAALEAETDQATKLGVFGAPSFVVRDEVFWGDDRLDDALSWARVGARHLNL